MNLASSAATPISAFGQAANAVASLRAHPGGDAGALRFDRLDALRGAAVVWMAVFHLAFDLSHFGLTRQNFYLDPFWTMQRSAIVALFLFCAGAGQAIASAQHQPWRRFWSRWARVAGCAALVSLASWWMFPLSYISFGVLHALAVMLIVARLSVKAGAWLWALGALAIGLAQVVRHPFFDTRATNWIGLVTERPVTEDYVPLLPWLGVVWWGVACGHWLMAHRHGWLAGGLPAAATPLAALGRWSLSFYMLHQPVFMGALMLLVWLRR